MKTQDYLDSILDDAEKAQLEYFMENEVMREAVKKVLLVGIYGNGTLQKGKRADPLRNFALGLASNQGELPNEILGQQLRAAWEGINSLELAFSTLAKYKSTPERSVPKSNQAR
jgi:hypothetical protein